MEIGGLELAFAAEVDGGLAITEVDIRVEVDGFGEQGLIGTEEGAGDDETGEDGGVVEERLFQIRVTRIIAPRDRAEMDAVDAQVFDVEGLEGGLICRQVNRLDVAGDEGLEDGKVGGRDAAVAGGETAEVDLGIPNTEEDVGFEVDGFGEDGLVDTRHHSRQDETGKLGRTIENRRAIIGAIVIGPGNVEFV